MTLTGNMPVSYTQKPMEHLRHTIWQQWVGCKVNVRHIIEFANSL